MNRFFIEMSKEIVEAFNKTIQLYDPSHIGLNAILSKPTLAHPRIWEKGLCTCTVVIRCDNCLDTMIKDLEAFNPERKCECGKEKHGFARHSEWCDLYE